MARRITQETFDEAVKENIEDLEMEPEEAVEDAVTQFESQGVDLSNIDKTLRLGGSAESDGEAHPALVLVNELKAKGATPAAGLMIGGDSDVDVGDIVAKLEALGELVSKDKDTQRLVGAHDGVSAVLAVLPSQEHPEAGIAETKAEAAETDPPAGAAEEAAAAAAAPNTLTTAEMLAVGLRVVAALLDGQPDLVCPPPGLASGVDEMASMEQLAGPAGLARVAGLMNALRGPVGRGEPKVQAAGLTAVWRACLKHEGNRQAFVHAGIVSHVLGTIEQHADERVVVAEAAHTLRVLTFDDDVRVPFGKAHDTVKAIVTEHDAVPRITQALQVWSADGSVSRELLLTMSRLPVRSEYCQSLVDAGGLDAVLGCLDAHADSSPGVVQACCGVLRAIAGNDDVRKLIYERGGISALLSAASRYAKQAAVAEHACAALAALALRNPVNCAAIAAEGGPHFLIQCMTLHEDQPKVVKHAARALRNIVSRSPDLRPAVIDEGAERVLNDALRRHPKACGDDAKAALRDLGLKVELKELWTGAVKPK
eukprot:m.102664 g.102664  ORF g.102664 m.102664 type:complete len:540 (-) comp15521_c1_seq3:108-1727(-)